MTPNSVMKTRIIGPASIITLIYFVLAVFYFTPFQVPHKLVFPLAFLTLCSIRWAPWTMVLAMGFSALGDWMGTCHNFWGQMGFFALAHLAYILFFSRSCKQGRAMGKAMWKCGVVLLYGLVVGVLVLRHVSGVLQIGVLVYMLLIMVMCAMAWMQENRYYAIGAWLFVVSDTILAWNKFVAPIEWAGYLIMVPYYLGQWVLFVQVLKIGVERKRVG